MTLELNVAMYACLSLSVPFSMFGGLPGDIQNAPRGELYCILMLVKVLAASKTVSVIVDSAFVHDHIQLPTPRLADLADSDLWLEIRRIVLDTDLKLTTRKVKSHLVETFPT